MDQNKVLSFIPAEIIKKKRNKLELSNDEINWMIQEFTNGNLPDYQMSALLMAIYFNGLNKKETLALTNGMINSGRVMSYPNIAACKVDKHSTGGVGDKTSLILAPIVAACGIVVPMISGRGLGHTGGTLDKLESIPNFNVNLSLAEFSDMLSKFGLSFIGQTAEICPADKKMYALRDVTATVESQQLICASIMSKKIAEGIDALVLDVKFGTGAFMKSIENAESLARSLKEIGEGAGKKVNALLTNMNQPLGSFIGNSLEVYECVEILKNKKLFNERGVDLYTDTRELSLELAAHMIVLGNKATTIAEGKKLAINALETGRALALWNKVCEAQGGNLSELPKAKFSRTLKSTRNGYVAAIQTEAIGISAILIGAGRVKTIDKLDYTAGIQIHFKLGEKIEIGDSLFTIYSDDQNNLTKIDKNLIESIEWSVQKLNFAQLNKLIEKVI